ncbi:MAG: hypothetical protein LCH81_12535 [Bacteroidetes bacterium]|nr:hypothetical protein [Bacteroidota bacterium]
MIDQLQVSDFSHLDGHTLHIRFSPEVTLEARLIEVSTVHGNTPLERHPFHLILQTQQKDEYYQQAIYTLIHPEKGDLHLFMVPLGNDGNGMRYEIVFS